MQWLASAQLMSTSMAETALFCIIQRPGGGEDAVAGQGVASGGLGPKVMALEDWELDGTALKGQRGASDSTAPVTATSVIIAMNSDGVCQWIAGQLRSCPA